MTNLLFVSWYVGLGGGETALLSLAHALDPERYTPHLLLPYDGQLAERWRAAGWPVHFARWRGATTYFIPALWSRLPVSSAIERLIHEQDIDAVHSDYHTLPMALPAAQRAGIPAVWTCWGWWFHPKFWQRDFFLQPDMTFFPSRAIREGFLGDPPFTPRGFVDSKTTLLPPGVDSERFHPNVDGLRVRFEAGVQPDTPLVVLVARFQDVKGHHIFQDMARQVALQIPEARFIVAGEDIHGVAAEAEYKQRILHTARTDPLLRERMIYLGFRDDSERVLAAADVVVCSSYFESYGMVNVEAMATGKPVVSTNKGGPSETVEHGHTGFLVEPGDVTAFASYVITLLREPERRARMGAAGRERVERKYSAQAAGATFSRVIEKLLTQRRKGAKTQG